MRPIRKESARVPEGHKRKEEPMFFYIIKNAKKVADQALGLIEEAEGNEDMLANAIQLLYSLTAWSERYTLHGAIVESARNNRPDVVEEVMKHPILSILLLYLFVSTHSDEQHYLHWRVSVVEQQEMERVGFWRRKHVRPVYISRLDYEINSQAPDYEPQGSPQ